MSKILIKNGIIVTLGSDNRVLYDHSILIEDAQIARVAPSAEIKDEVDMVIDAHNKVVMPGFINAHMHSYSTFARGLTKNTPAKNFQELLENLWWRLDKKLLHEDVYMSAMIAFIQAVRHGTTTMLDHHSSPYQVPGSLQEIVKAARATGVRACLSYEISDRDGADVVRAGMAENANTVERCRKEEDAQFKALLGLHASFTLSDETLEKMAALGQELQTGFHVHMGESLHDQSETLEHYGERVVERFKSHGILGPKTIAAHCVHLDEREMDLLAGSDTMVVHCPQSNMYHGVGIADVVALTNKGILVGLGTDGMAPNMSEEVRVALWGQHLRTGDPSVGFSEVVNALYFNNAKIANRIWENVKLGAIKPGYAADVVILDYIPPTPLDEVSLFSHLIFGLSQAAVDTTIARGEILMRDKQLTIDIDEAALCAESRALSTALWRRF